jgi:nitronate monooxygenase
MDLNERGEPIYGEKDEVDLLKFLKASKGLPFWLAGSYAKPEKLRDVTEIGGAGVQVGTLFALSDEAGLDPNIRQKVLNRLAEGDMDVFTDPAASPTGFPFKVLEIEDTLADEKVYKDRPRVCNLGYLRMPYVRPDGKIGYRCPSEPVDAWVKKGGEIEATEGRKCLCNSLCANVGFPQVHNHFTEPPLITIGDDVNSCRRFLKQDADGQWGYSAKDVVKFLRSSLDNSTEGEVAVKLDDKTNIKELVLTIAKYQQLISAEDAVKSLLSSLDENTGEEDLMGKVAKYRQRIMSHVHAAKERVQELDLKQKETKTSIASLTA